MTGSDWKSAFRSLLLGSGLSCMPWPVVRREAHILMFHGVAAPSPGRRWTPLRSRMTTVALESLLKALSRHHRFTTLEHVVSMVRGDEPLVPRSVALTFDDGHRSTYRDAWPILREYGVPATFFLSTGNAGRREPYWFDRLDYALQFEESRGAVLEVEGLPGIPVPGTGDRDALAAFFRSMRRLLKSSFKDDREMHRAAREIAERLEERAGRSLAEIFEEDGWSSLMSPEEVRDAARQGISFGSHTVDHMRIGILPEDVAADQLERSRRDIERWSGRPCRHFCYPNGSYSPRAVDLVRQAGYEGAVTTDSGGAGRGDDPACLPRLSGERKGPPEDILFAMSPAFRLKRTLLRRVSSSRRDTDRSLGE